MLNIYFIKNKDMYWPAFCTSPWWLEHFSQVQLSRAERQSKVKTTAPKSFTVWLKSLPGTQILHWLSELSNGSPKMCTVLWVLEEIDHTPIPSSLHLLFLQKLLKHFMPGKDAEFFSPRGKKFVKGYLYSWNCENLEISLSLVLAQAALCSPAANILS